VSDHVRGRRPARVLFVHYGDDWVRGSERALLDLLAHLDRTRFDPYVWTNSQGLKGEVEKQETPVLHTPLRYVLDGVGTWGDFRAQVRQARALLRDERIDLVHANSGAPVQWMVPAARSERIPLLAHLHSLYSLRYRCGLLLHQAQLVVGGAEAAVADLRQDGLSADRTPIVYYGVDPLRVLQGDATALRSELGIGRDEVVVTCGASLIRRKGIDVLLRALAVLSEHDPPIRVLLVGNGPDQEGFVSLAGELGVAARATFLGERADLGAIFRDATDIAVLPSREELFGLVNLEAGLAKKPVVASRVGGIPEAVEDERTGLLVQHDDPRALAGALSRLARDSVLREKMGAAAHQRVLEGFTAQLNAERIQELYEGLLVERPWGWLRWQMPRAYARWIGGAMLRRLRSTPPSPPASP